MFPYTQISDEALLKLTLMNRAYQSESGCWVWKGSKRKGYGLMWRDGQATSAHRVCYEAFKGPIPKGMVVRHSCDNPSCINPGHLDLGTQAENVADREARGRRDVKGEQVGTAKLTEANVLEIRSSEVSGVKLAKKFGVHPTTISFIKSRKTWTHVMEANHGR
jgi:hypothetical protein